MILPDHNAHLTMVQSPPVIADAQKGIVAAGPIVKWKGDAQAHLSVDRKEAMHGGTLVTISQIVATVPANLVSKIIPKLEVEDLVTFESNGETQILKLRDVDERYRLIGKVELTLRRS